MDIQYSTYLNSDAWKAKRHQRLALSNFRCSVCETTKQMHVHHLTYERIFNEDMADLMPLCSKHHEAAENLVANGLIKRKGNVLFLATETIRLIMRENAKSEKLSKARKRDHVEVEDTRNQYQDMLMREAWFTDSMHLNRKQFKQVCRKHLEGNSKFVRIMANCFALYDRYKGLTVPGYK